MQLEYRIVLKGVTVMQRYPPYPLHPRQAPVGAHGCAEHWLRLRVARSLCAYDISPFTGGCVAEPPRRWAQQVDRVLDGACNELVRAIVADLDARSFACAAAGGACLLGHRSASRRVASHGAGGMLQSGVSVPVWTSLRWTTGLERIRRRMPTLLQRRMRLVLRNALRSAGVLRSDAAVLRSRVGRGMVSQWPGVAWCRNGLAWFRVVSLGFASFPHGLAAR